MRTVGEEVLEQAAKAASRAAEAMRSDPKRAIALLELALSLLRNMVRP